MRFKILCREGDDPYDYPTEVAELKFNELKQAGMLPVVYEGTKAVALKDFDPDIEEVTWLPAIRGG
jgi:hypothetical protein